MRPNKEPSDATCHPSVYAYQSTQNPFSMGLFIGFNRINPSKAMALYGIDFQLIFSQAWAIFSQFYRSFTTSRLSRNGFYRIG